MLEECSDNDNIYWNITNSGIAIFRYRNLPTNVRNFLDLERKQSPHCWNVILLPLCLSLYQSLDRDIVISLVRAYFAFNRSFINREMTQYFLNLPTKKIKTLVSEQMDIWLKEETKRKTKRNAQAKLRRIAHSKDYELE